MPTGGFTQEPQRNAKPAYLCATCLPSMTLWGGFPLPPFGGSGGGGIVIGGASSPGRDSSYGPSETATELPIVFRVTTICASIPGCIEVAGLGLLDIGLAVHDARELGKYIRAVRESKDKPAASVPQAPAQSNTNDASRFHFEVCSNVGETLDPVDPSLKVCHYKCPSGRAETRVQEAWRRCEPRVIFGP